MQNRGSRIFNSHVRRTKEAGQYAEVYNLGTRFGTFVDRLVLGWTQGEFVEPFISNRAIAVDLQQSPFDRG